MLEQIWRTKLFELSDGATIEVSQVVLALAVLVLGVIASALAGRIVARRLTRARVRAGAAMILQKVIFYTLLVVILLTTLRILHVPITAFAFLGGAVAIGVGFGAQNIINNFISGWILIAERPVRLGDLIEVEEQPGRVESIGARCTRIRRSDGIDLLVPNSKLLEGTVINWTLIDEQVRAKVRVGVIYGSPTEQVRRLLLQAVEENGRILPDPEPIVVFEDFGDDALVFDVYFWLHASAPMQVRQVASSLRFRIDELFREAGLVIAFPQRDVHLDTLRPLEVQVVAAPQNP